MDHPFNSMIGKFICHFDVDSFYCACECIRRPELKNEPFAVTQFNSGGFVSVNNIARLAGVRKGDGIGAGGQKALDHFKNRPDALMGEVLKRCPDLIVLPMDTIWYRQVSSNIENALKIILSTIEKGNAVILNILWSYQIKKHKFINISRESKSKKSIKKNQIEKSFKVKEVTSNFNSGHWTILAKDLIGRAHKTIKDDKAKINFIFTIL